MKVFKCNRKNNKWHKKIDWLYIIILTLISFSISFLCFSFLRSFKAFDITIKYSLLISSLIFLDLFLRQMIENRDKIFLIKNKKISYISIHDNRDGKFITDREYHKMVDAVDIEEVIKELNNFVGVDYTMVEDILKIKKRRNGCKIHLDIKSKEWKAKGVFSSDVVLVDKEYKKKIFIPNDYDDYNELIDLFDALRLKILNENTKAKIDRLNKM